MLFYLLILVYLFLISIYPIDKGAIISVNKYIKREIIKLKIIIIGNGKTIILFPNINEHIPLKVSLAKGYKMALIVLYNINGNKLLPILFIKLHFIT